MPAAPVTGQSFVKRTTEQGAGLAAEPVHARSDTVVVNTAASGVASDYAAAVGRTSSGNPFVADKKAQKQVRRAPSSGWLLF